MSDDSTDDPRPGIEFGSLDDDFDRLDYPVTTVELLDAYGDRTFELESGTTTLAGALDPVSTQTFQSSDAVRKAVYAMVGDDAVGRTGDTDRGTGTPAENDASF
ncbi:DUF5789 family protein [Salinigranum sp. GCM10025319]|uniref:DUF5789 family protein n=1 Tax=Salinigranum sp. GCM10025319 TaxID=3252687 RepID=UPI0036137FF0